MAEAAERVESFWTRLATFYHEVMTELKRVTWPDKGQVRQATVAIILFVLFVGLVIYLMDLVMQGVLVRLIPSLFGG